MTNYRLPVGYAGEAIQQSMVRRQGDNNHLLASGLELGIILSIYPSDSTENRTAQESTLRRGWRHECTVQVVSSGHGGMYKLTNVVIPPRSPSGVDNYEEQLPRGCSVTFKEGGQFDPSMQMSNPYDLDGDWCVIGFLKRDRDQPFILSWWPNPNNPYDPQTQGTGNPNSSGQGTALKQAGRYFRRTNGIEYTITKDGNVYFDTTFGGEPIVVTEPVKQGRIARTKTETGGNIYTVLKPSASVEIDFNTPQDGIGYLDSADPQIPQSNPPTTRSSSTQRSNSYLKFNKDVLHLKCPSTIRFNSSLFEADATDSASITSKVIQVGKDDTDTWVSGNSCTMELTDGLIVYADTQLQIETPKIDITGFPEITANATNVTLEAINVDIAANVTIQSTSAPSLPLLNQSVANASQIAAAALPLVPGGTLGQHTTTLTAILTYLKALNQALQDGQTSALLSA